MKKCEYINCENSHNRKSKFCKASCKTRQWEIDNNKAPFLSNKTVTKKKTGTISKHLTNDFFRTDVNGNKVLSIPAKYRTEIVPLEAGQFALKFALLGSVAAPLVHREKLTPKSFMWWVASGFVFGLVKDLIRPKFVEQQVLIEEARTQIIPSVEPKQNKQRMTSSEYKELNIERLGLTGKYKNLFGDPAANFYMVVDGRPGNGKSYWVAELAQHIHRNHGRVIYYAAEQNGQNLALQEMVKTLGTTFEIETKPHTLSKAKILQDMKNYSLVIMDSIQQMGLKPQEIREMRKQSNSALIGVLQSTKDGQHKGGQEWLHDVDISIQITRYQPHVRKTRFKKLESSDLGRIINL